MNNLLEKLKNFYSQVIPWCMSLFQRDDEHEFKPLLLEIEDSPMSPLGRFTYWMVIVILITLILWMFIGVVDVVVTVKGKIIPDGEVKVVQSFTPGVIRTIRVKETDFVTKGAVIMEIESNSARTDLGSFKQALTIVSLDVLRLDALLNNKPFLPDSQFPPEQVRVAKDMYQSAYQNQTERLGSKRTEIYRIDEQIKGLQDSANFLRKMLSAASDTQQRLKKVSDLIPQADVDRAQHDVLSYRTNLADNLSRMMELRQQQSQIRQELSSLQQTFRESLLQDYNTKQNKKAELEAQIAEKEFLISRTIIISPVDGHVQKLLINTIGGVVNQAQPLATIVPSDVALVVKASLSPADKGFIKKGMTVAIKLDAFSFQKYGMLNGMVSAMSSDTTEVEKNQPMYDLYITPFDKYLNVEGKKEYITTGMTLTAEVKIGKRRIIEFFVYPLVKYLDEGVTVR